MGKLSDTNKLSPKSANQTIRNNVSVRRETRSVGTGDGQTLATIRTPLSMSSVPSLYPNYESRKISNTMQLPYTKRDQWNNKVEFLMVSLSVAVGLGNVWRFPFTAYQNGGGAFLIPYLIIVTVVARPLYFLELAAGQFCSRSPVGMWDAVPLLRGIGWAIVVVSTVTGLYYVSILATCGLYIVYGLRSKLPWGECDKKLYHRYSRDSYIFKDNLTHFQCLSKFNNKTKIHEVYGQYCANVSNPSNCTIISTSELFYHYVVAQSKDSIEDGIGMPSWEMCTSLLLVWIIIFANISSGTKSTGKGAYFTALFPYVVLFTLFGRACFLDGALDGMLYFVKPDFKKLMDINVWYEAMSQSFFSLGIGYGSVIVCGSYNPLHQATYNDALIIGIIDTLSSFLAGFTVFSILGVLTVKTGNSIEDVVSKSGSGLAFVSFPELMLHFGSTPGPQIFSFLFFSMLLALGVGTSVSIVQVISSTILDRKPSLSDKESYKVALAGVICFFLYLGGLIFCTPGGLWMVEIFDYYGAGFVVFLLVMLEVAGIAYVYGMKNFERDMMFMFANYKCPVNCKIFRYWGYLTPLLFISIIVYVFIKFEPIELAVFGKAFPMPLWSQVIAWFLVVSIMGIPPVYAVFVIFTRKASGCYKKWMASVTPSRHWGPKIPEEKLIWVRFKQDYDGSSLLWKKIRGILPLPPDPEITPVQSVVASEKDPEEVLSQGSGGDLAENKQVLDPDVNLSGS